MPENNPYVDEVPFGGKGVADIDRHVGKARRLSESASTEGANDPPFRATQPGNFSDGSFPPVF
jgi:hypothetical protein